MKNLIISMLLFSTPLFAKGWMGFGLERHSEGTLPSLSVGVSELLVGNISYESWNALGPNIRQTMWATTKHDLVVDLTNAELRFGVSLRHNDINSSDVHAEVRVPLWE